MRLVGSRLKLDRQLASSLGRGDDFHREVRGLCRVYRELKCKRLLLLLVPLSSIPANVRTCATTYIFVLKSVHIVNVGTILAYCRFGC